jgi:hypothetical protein
MHSLSFFGSYENLSGADQFLHSLHFILCALAVVVALVPLRTEKGSLEHKAAGFVYLPLSFLALFLGSIMAWREHSAVLFCFDSFCAYLLLSGWRAVHEKDAPDLLDWIMPISLTLLGLGSIVYVLIHDDSRRSLYLLFFAMNAFYLSSRDYQHLRRRMSWHRNRIFLAGLEFGSSAPESWINRHVAGMAGSAIANLSVVVLTLLPLRLHWLWPVSLIVIALVIARQQKTKRQKQMRPQRALRPAFGITPSVKSR